MKIRNGFVSNSSSSSFIVVGRPPKNNNVKSVKLTKDQVKTVIKELKKTGQYTDTSLFYELEYEIERKKIDTLTDDTELYITEFVSDSRHDYKDMCSDPEVISFHDGSHGCPYDEEEYYELDTDVWFPKTEEERETEGYHICPNCNYSFKDGDEE